MAMSGTGEEEERWCGFSMEGRQVQFPVAVEARPQGARGWQCEELEIGKRTEREREIQ